MTWVSCSARVAVVSGVATTESVDDCDSGLSLGGVYWIPWVVNTDDMQGMES